MGQILLTEIQHTAQTQNQHWKANLSMFSITNLFKLGLQDPF